MVVQDTSTTGRRSRLSAEREQELFEAVLDHLREVGYEALTMDAVAARTRSSKATLYRQWHSKPHLVATALRHGKPVRSAGIDTGTLRGDLVQFADGVCQSAEKDSALLRAVAFAQQSNEELQQAMRQLLIEPELAAFQELIDRAVARGELPADIPAAKFVPHMMLGAMLARPLIENAPVTSDYLVRYVDAVILPALHMN
ncbi:TetR/AcrR family transcriptional regulator C-terminal ligand-binding domain-containing protein [Streptomyces sp. NBC_01808]|uniref:TetR/AcrR family transcriptional regulator n=1 Tax=Streptomyces sp. NBC_01808 TaxID=2975947 RepID=UPI002DDBBE23|nr:TetR/AcrR family transcriptional regulator [Streptomyces sp. NBC_01808]WSA36596.1 TetR/AcrR family transcriptional regulator C-terminal ligand-binding domain-containing protein [Streptomyces sp. NBC_01808]